MNTAALVDEHPIHTVHSGSCDERVDAEYTMAPEYWRGR